MQEITMEKQVRNSFLLSSTFIAFLFVPIKSAILSNPLFLFGDSMMDVGNNNYINTTTLAQCNFYPYGITFFHSATGRNSDGRLIGDFIAQHANLSLIPPYLQPGEPQFYNGVNFASGGSGALVETHQGLVIDLYTQLRYYKKVVIMYKHKFGDVKAKMWLSKAVYLLSAGGNDYAGSFLSDPSPIYAFTETEYVNMVIGNITTVITEIYKTGGRKFALLNAPPVGCVPLARLYDVNGDCKSEPLNYTILHNKALVHVLRKLRIQLPGFKFSLFDFYNGIQRRIDYPSLYGYKEGKVACCGTGSFRGVLSCGGKRPVPVFELCENVDDYVFWDSFHFTEKFYRQIADEMWNSRSYGSYSIKDLFHLP